jgi:hypothetical protein
MALTTLANVKQYLQIEPDDTSADDLLERMIDAASVTIERYCGRTFLQANYTEVRHGTGQRRMSVRNIPMTAVSSVTVNGRSIPARPGATGQGFTFDQYCVNLTGYDFTDGYDNVAISYTAGFAAVPADVDLACCELVSLRYKTIDRLGVTSKSLAGESISFNMGDFSEPVKRALDQYRVWGA